MRLELCVLTFYSWRFSSVIVLMLCNKSPHMEQIKTPAVYYLTVSAAQKSSTVWLAPRAGSHWAEVKRGWGWALLGSLGTSSKFVQVVGGFTSLRLEDGGPSCLWLQAAGCSRSLAPGPGGQAVTWLRLPS